MKLHIKKNNGDQEKQCRKSKILKAMAIKKRNVSARNLTSRIPLSLDFYMHETSRIPLSIWISNCMLKKAKIPAFVTAA